MVVLLLFAFLSGLATILAPCIWPLLPIILSSSIAGSGHRRPLGITLGVMLSFGIFTLTISSLVRAFHFDPNVLRLFAVIVIGTLGFAMIIPSFNKALEGTISRISGAFGQKGQVKGDGFIPGFITGISLGVVWAPCAGPILASIATLSATGQVSTSLVVVTFFYVLGVGIPLFIFAYGGRELLTKTKSISPYLGKIQQVFGVIMILTAVAIFTNYDKTIQVKLLDIFPQYSEALTALESNDEVRTQLDQLKGDRVNKLSLTESDLFNVNPPKSAPEFVGVTKWLNTEGAPTLSELRGKVVLVDFWTYTCINCIRTLPHVTSWYDKYSKDGFVVIGVHTPEFEFEKNTANVQDAIKRFSIHYPVLQDNDYSTWNAYSNQYWPAEYLIDAKGQVRRVHFGEGEYEEMEEAIQLLLKEAGRGVEEEKVNMPDETPQTRNTPETYLGARRAEYYYLSGRVVEGRKEFKTESSIPVNTYSLGGIWTVGEEQIISGNKSEITQHFSGRNVFLVMGPGKNTNAKVKVFLDGEEITTHSGEDVKAGEVTLDSYRLYSLISLDKQEEHTLKLQFLTPGTEVYAFTFG